MSWKEAALEHARSCYPQEACGLVVIFKGREKYVPARNVSHTPRSSFVISAEDYAAAADMGEVVAIFHSHPDESAHPSGSDVRACRASGMPWHIVSLPDGAWIECSPDQPEWRPLIGRVFKHGSDDCYSLIRDWYAQERGVKLLDFDRPDDWWERGMNLYLDGFPKAGFVVSREQPAIGDVLLMQIESPVPNHAAIYLGDDLILHHLHGRLSSRDVYSGYYRQVTTHCLRYAA